MTAEHIIATPPFLTSFTSTVSKDGEHVFIENFHFRIQGELLSEPDQKAILGTYILDLEEERTESLIQDALKNSEIFYHYLDTAGAPSSDSVKKLLQLLEQNCSSYRILNGQEFFSTHYAYLIKFQDYDIFIGGRKESSSTLVISVKIPKNSYDEHTQKILECLKSTLIKKHREDFLRFRMSHADLDFLSSTSIEGLTKKTVTNIIKFLRENNLIITPSAIGNYAEKLKYSDLSELGWALSKFMEKKWLHTKTVKSGNPDFNTLKKEIDTLKKKLEIK